MSAANAARDVLTALIRSPRGGSAYALHFQTAMELDHKVPEDFYRACLDVFVQSKIDFVIGGAFSLKHYTGITRNTSCSRSSGRTSSACIC